ncbi:sodium ion-translocating decarboxylase subunit beta [Maledivibacter halophilus]|uniref:Na+-transporting methylmalonyl-CoA/oxaloacetate decarboxylase, beta subunit n=1 Tax=Maledivibacter halophilus TaxID=36842 RepID=A0A1T5LTD4_9FIRM|nr:sodium ion-translocating decarboxylase subunit beta [Maledivibacter halophilus]SKC79233.1 Na+-transporting methylmalonyl-CoA/oxaloacetate decarboxylase, beta subunit [Maledivibacter halophilus]
MKLRKVVTLLTIIIIIITFINLGFNFLLPMYLSYKLNSELDEPASTAIIGGADGPTAIYLTTQLSSNILTIILILLSIAGILYLFFTKKAVK